jgi:hypothetical protein
VEADESAEDAGADGDSRRNYQHMLEAIGQKVGDCAGGHEHGDDQNDPHRLEGCNDRQRKQYQKAVVDHGERQPYGARMLRIEAVE